MSMRAWIGLAAVTAAAVAGAAYVAVERDGGRPERRYEETLFPGLIDRVNDVAKVTIRQGGAAWTIVRQDGGKWVMAEKDGYPASVDKVKQAVVALATLRILDEKTAKPELYAKIGVGAVDAEGSKSILIGLDDADGEELAALLVGKTKSYGTDTAPAKVFVRKPGDRESWLVEARLDIKGDALSWLERETLKVTKGRVRKVAIAHPDGERVLIERHTEKTGSFILRDIPKGYRKQSDYRIGAVAAGLESLTFEDVRRADEDAFGDKAIRTVVETNDGLRIRLGAVTEGGHTWLRIDAAFDETLAGEDADKQAVEKEAAAIAGRTVGWAYRVPDYRAENFTWRLKDLIEKIEPAKGS